MGDCNHNYINTISREIAEKIFNDQQKLITKLRQEIKDRNKKWQEAWQIKENQNNLLRQQLASCHDMTLTADVERVLRFYANATDGDYRAALDQEVDIGQKARACLERWSREGQVRHIPKTVSDYCNDCHKAFPMDEPHQCEGKVEPPTSKVAIGEACQPTHEQLCKDPTCDQRNIVHWHPNSSGCNCKPRYWFPKHEPDCPFADALKESLAGRLGGAQKAPFNCPNE